MSRIEYKDWSKNDLIREILRFKQAVQEAYSVRSEGVLMVDGKATADGSPFVQITDGEYSTQLEPGAARTHALVVLNAAVEAERDAATVAFLQQKMSLDNDGISVFLTEMRDHRKDWVKDHTAALVTEGDRQPPASS